MKDFSSIIEKFKVDLSLNLIESNNKDFYNYICALTLRKSTDMNLIENILNLKKDRESFRLAMLNVNLSDNLITKCLKETPDYWFDYSSFLYIRKFSKEHLQIILDTTVKYNSEIYAYLIAQPLISYKQLKKLRLLFGDINFFKSINANMHLSKHCINIYYKDLPDKAKAFKMINFPIAILKRVALDKDDPLSETAMNELSIRKNLSSFK